MEQSKLSCHEAKKYAKHPALQNRSLCPPNLKLVYTFHTRHLTSNACLILKKKVLFTHREFKIEEESIFPRLKKLGFHEEGGRLYPTRKSKRASFFLESAGVVGEDRGDKRQLHLFRARPWMQSTLYKYMKNI